MQRHRLSTSASLLALGLLAAGSASATNGYFSHGYGVKSQGLAGAGIALPQDGLAAATNPAGTAFIGERADLGLVFFRPERGADVSGNPADSGSYDGNGKKNFFIPEFGYVAPINAQWTAGVAVYGNGGMNTDYGVNPWRNFPGTKGAAGINLEQLFIAPSLAYKVDERHAFGVNLIAAYQRFEAKGLGAFDNAGFSAAPGSVTNRGKDSSTGWGLRVGYTGKLTPELTLGLTYAGKVKTGEFDKYKGLFAEQGGFDVPANFGAGLAWQASRDLTLAADVQRIEYSGVKSVGNPLDVAALFAGNQFGSSNGQGFGWRDVTVVKLGASYALDPDLTLRAGVSHVSQPVQGGQTFLNILAPGVVQDHLSLGATWKHGKTGELSLSYTHAFRKTVSGAIPAAFGGGAASLHMDQNIVGLAYGWKY